MREETIDLGFRARKWQGECLRKLRRFSVLVVHRRGGKTVLAIMRLISAALSNGRGAPRYAYIAPQLNQAKDVAWSYLKHYALKVPGTGVNESELFVEFPNGARVRVYGADNPDRLRGIYLDGVVMDEVADMKPEVWDEVVLPTLTDRQGWALFIGTPKGVNRFSELYDRATGPHWFRRLFDVYSTDALPPDEIELARQSMPESAFRQEYLCDFTAANENTLIPLPLVTEARRRHLKPDAYQHAGRVLGVDVARYGDDRTVIVKRQGLVAHEPIVLKGADSMTVAARVAGLKAEWEADAIMVDGSGGYGAGVIDRLRQLGHAVLEVQFGGKASDARFANKRTEMWWAVKDWLEAGGVLPDNADLSRELSAPTYSLDNAKGLLALEPKDKIKERIGVSPDLADALAITFAYPVAPRLMARLGGLANSYIPQQQRAEVYNPL